MYNTCNNNGSPLTTVPCQLGTIQLLITFANTQDFVTGVKNAKYIQC